MLSRHFAAKSILRLALCALLSLTAGCMVGPRYRQPAAATEPLPPGYKELPANFKAAKGWKVAQPEDEMLRGQWWKVFKDPELDALEDQLNINNQNIKQYFQNFMAARAMVSEAIAQYYPTLTANTSYTRAGSSGALPIATIPASLEVSWEADLWGKIRYAVREAQFNAQLSAGDLENERLSEQANLAIYYFEIRGQDALQKLYNDTIVADKKAVDYTKAQYDTGITDEIALVEATNTLQNAEASATNIGVARAEYEHAIAVLVGRVASNFSIPVRVLKSTPPPIPVGFPSQLLERRPDVAAAERALAAANAQIGIAYTAFYPTLTLGGQNGFQTSGVGFFGGSALFDKNNHSWSIGPSGSHTIFDGGLRSATVRQYVAVYNADLASYRETVLTAFQQAEDYLAQVRLLSTQLLQQKAAEQSAEKYLKLEMGRYQTGIDPYVDVVTAQTTLLSDQQAVITVQTQAMTGAVQLVKALGGGWNRSDLPTPSQVSRTPPGADTAIQN